MKYFNIQELLYYTFIGKTTARPISRHQLLRQYLKYSFIWFHIRALIPSCTLFWVSGKLLYVLQHDKRASSMLYIDSLHRRLQGTDIIIKQAAKKYRG